VPLYEKYEFDFFVELIIESPRSIISLFGIFLDLQKEEEKKRATKLYETIRDTAYAKGYPPYRASMASTHLAFDSNPALGSVVQDIKNALDPQNILAPGKYGTQLRK
jgi:4-cresol dehydrogenase (hydroxylating)